jgi:tetratricopeptide (TPR) repeat protein
MKWPESGSRFAFLVGAVLAALIPLLACAGGEDSSRDRRAAPGLDPEPPAPPDPQFRYALQDAVAAAAEGRLEAAAELARSVEVRAVELNDLDAALEMAILPGLWWLWATGEADVAVATVEAALSGYAIGELTPPRRVDLILAAFFADAGHTPRAKAFLSRYVQDVRPGAGGGNLELPPGYYGARGAIALAERRFAEAIRALESAAAGESRDLLAPDFRLGLAWERAGARDSATRAYERFVERFESELAGPQLARPDAWAVPYALTSLGDLYEESGDEQKAAGYFERFVQLWEAADPPLQVEVVEVHERLRGLRH